MTFSQWYNMVRSKGGRAVRKEAELWIRDALYDLDCASDMLEKKREIRYPLR